ncbi:DgyrCDS14799, partial [Dimorphilus gyrociliatus]
KMENKLLNYHYTTIKDCLENVSLFETHLKSKRIVTTDSLEECGNFESIFKKHICHMKTGDLIEILLNMDLEKCYKLVNLIKNTWNNLLEKRKECIMEEFGTIKKFPFQKYNDTSINFKNILTPVQIVPSSKNSQNNCTNYNSDIDDDIYQCVIEEGCQRILVRGDAGMGKTFHSMKLLYNWATSDNSLRDYLLLKVNLADIEDDDDLEKTLFLNNFTENTGVNLQLFQYFFTDYEKDCKERKKILLLLDGADELKYENSKFYSIITKINQIKYPVIVWSRHWKMRYVIETYDRIFEIIGFSPYNVKLYFRKFFNEENTPSLTYENMSNQLFKYLNEEKKDILEICRYPLVANLIAGLWEETKHEKLSDEYSIFKEVIKITLSNRGIEKGSNNYIEAMKYCSKVAFENLVYDKKINSNEIFEKTNYFGGILTPVKVRATLNSSTNKNEYKFIHFSFQEYLTANYIIKEFPNEVLNTETLKLILDKSKNLYLLTKVFLFIQQRNREVFIILVKINIKILSIVSDTNEQIIQLLKDRKQSSELSEIKLYSLNMEISMWKLITSFFNNSITEIDFFHVQIDFLKFIAISKSTLKGTLKTLKVCGGVKNSISVEILEKLLYEMVNLVELNISNIQFEYNEKMGSVTLSSENLKKLTLKNCNIEVLGENSIDLHCSNLCFLNLSGNNLQESSLKSLFENIENIMEDIQYLNLSRMEDNSIAFEYIYNQFKFTNSILE